ncbi:MAG: hypothetical protein EKK31_11590 [Hyphomicrobiales bacterium]|nr:MAG: hypothetical protein EKK31_11590 [Hyphomicrobiales bacterium]
MTSIQIDIKDGLSSSVAIKGPCRVATTANITLSGEQTIDGVAVVTDDRVLVKDQTTGSENGIYIADTGAWRRSKDFNKTKDIKTGTMVNVVSGSTGAGWWEVTTTGDITVGTTSIVFARAVLATSQMIDEDDMASNSDTKVPTQQSVKAYVDDGPSTSALQATMRDRIDAAPYVASVAALKALDTTKDTTAFLTVAGRKFRLDWTSGDLSSQITAADPRYIASDASPTGSAGAWVYAGSVETGQFFQPSGANVHYLADRVMMGSAVNNKASAVSSQPDWLTTYQIGTGRSFGFIEFAQSAVLNNSNANAANAFVAGAQTSGFAGTGNSIGVVTVGVNNNTSFSTNTYGLYSEAYRASGVSGGAYGFEIDTVNYASLAATNPFAQATGQTVGIQVAAGGGLSAVGQFASSVGINFWNNNAVFDKGISFGFTAINGTNGTDGNTGEAIAMATGHAITYYYGNNTKSWTLKANTTVNGDYVFSTAGTGNVNVPRLTADQIKFPATQVPSSDANTLDDYEEGTWTPTITATSGTFTSTSATGSYTKIGRLVSIRVSITITTVGTASGGVVFTLPFTANATGGWGMAGRENASTGKMLQSLILGSATTSNAFYYDNTSAIAAGANLIISGTYWV